MPNPGSGSIKCFRARSTGLQGQCHEKIGAQTKRPKTKRTKEQNVPRHKVPGTKSPKEQNVPGTKRPKGQNVTRYKTSYTNYQIFKNKFRVRKLATYVRKWASSVHLIYDWGIPILGRLS